MGSGHWFKTIIRLRKSKQSRSKKAKGSLASEKSNSSKTKNNTEKESSGSANGTKSESLVSAGVSIETIAATRIQTAFRAYKVLDTDHIDRLISCLHMALPFVVRGASSSKFLNYINKYIIPVFDQLPGERKVDLLRSLAEFSPYTTPQDSRQMLPSIVQLLKKYMTWKKTGEEMNFTYVECLLYTFHHLAHKVPNATNSLCGYKIVTGQPSDRLGEDFSEHYNDFTERLKNVEEFTRATIKKLTQGMAENNKSMADAKTDEEKEKIKTKKQNATTGLRTCNNILAMTKPLHAKVPSFIGDKRINLSWKEATKPASSTTPAAGVKRPATATNGSNNISSKKGRGGGGLQNQLVNRALDGLSGSGRGGPRGRGRGRGGRGRGRGYR